MSYVNPRFHRLRSKTCPLHHVEMVETIHPTDPPQYSYKCPVCTGGKCAERVIVRTP